MIKKGFIFFFGLLFFLSCSKSSFNEYRVIPQPENHIVAAGDSSYIALKIEIPGKNHIYGNPKGPGTGKPTEVFPDGPGVFKFEPAKYLHPEKFYSPGDSDFTWAYSNETRIFIPFQVSEKADPGEYKIRIKYESLMCTDSACIPKDFNIEHNVFVVAQGQPVTKMPEDISKDYALSSAPSAKIPAIKDVKEPSGGNIQALVNEKFTPVMFDSGATNLIEAILFGILAGLILNFMPCVLPVVSLKIMGFVQHAGKNRKELTVLGLLFTAGIITSFLILAILAAFFGYSWGGLFQSRLFLIVMTSIVFAFALSMFGVFTLNSPGFAATGAKEFKNYYVDAYVKGLFATLLATPCSGPFLGGTLAWALSQSPAFIFLIFVSIGFGMALPYFILTINPKLLKFLPKPGEWLNTFEKIMAFLLIFTVVYLLSVFDRDSVMPMILFLGFLSLGLWQYGRFGAVFNIRRSRIISFLALIAITAGGYFFSFNYVFSVEDVKQARYEKFSVESLYARKPSSVSIVKWTAEWCPNCKLVEKISLNTDKVNKAVSENGIELFTADITQKNHEAEMLLEMLGGNSIPFLAVFPAGENFYKPICLRDVYSEDDVLKAIEKALMK